MSSSSISPEGINKLLAPALPGVGQMPWPGWHRVELSLRCDRLATAANGGRRRRRNGDASLPPEADDKGSSAQPDGQVLGEPLLAVFKAIWKHTAKNAGGLLPACYGPANSVPLALTPTLGSCYALRLVFAEQDVSRIKQWQEALHKHLLNKQHNYSITHMAEPEWRTWEKLLEEPLDLDLTAEELCLDFLTPMFFNKPLPASGLPPHVWLLTEPELRRRVAERWMLATGERPNLKELPALEVRPWYWEHILTLHTSKSQGRSQQPYAGCLGPLYLRGDWQAWLPWWRWLQEWGFGKDTANGLGCMVLSTKRTHFDRLLADPSRYEASLRSLLEDAEGADLELARLGAEPEVTARALAAEIKSSKYTPSSAKGFRLPKADGGNRLITEASAADRVVMQAAHKLLQDPLDRMLEDSCHGYRPGRGVDSACAALRRHLRAGATHVLEADVQSFFDELHWPTLEAALHRALPVADRRTKHLLNACARMPLTVDGRPVPRERGVLQGSALSPLLANLYLDKFDEDLARRGHALVRYGDDLRVMGRGESDCRRALADANELLAALHLKLNPEKTVIRAVDLGITFLGRSFGTDAEHRLLERGLLKTPLWVTNDWSFLGLEADTVILRRDGTKVGQYPLIRVSEMVLQGSHAISTSLVMRCARQGIPITFCRAGGEHVSTLPPAGMAWTQTAWQHTQRHQELAEEDRLEICRGIVAAKLGNYAAWFRQQRLPPPVDHLHLVESLRKSQSVMEIMGLEGDAARQTFKRVNARVTDEAFISHSRVQRQKPDRWNCLLDAAYMLLFHHLNVLVRSAGLNPYLGFLHSAENRFESLVCDLQEPFRHRIDRLVLRWLRLGMVKPEHFEKLNGRWSFTREGCSALLRAWHSSLHSGYSWEGGLTLAGSLQRQVLWLENWAALGGTLRCYHVPANA